MARRTLARELGALAVLLEPRREKLFRYVAGQRHPVSRDDAANSIGITRAMAAFHLDKLVDSGLLRAEYRRLSGRSGRGAGRPAKLYTRSRHRFDVTVPKRDTELLARFLTESINEQVMGPASTREAAHRYGRSLGVRARAGIGGPPMDDRLADCVEDVIDDIGFEPTRAREEIWARNCPFEPLSREYPAIVCQTALALIGGVIDGVGAPSIALTRRERPQWCCVVLHRTGAPELAQL
jgi:predicted ArsR family transcriptional regulator